MSPMTTRGCSGEGSNDLALLGIELEDGAWRRSADARLVEQGLGHAHLGARGADGGFCAARGRQVGLGLRLDERDTLALEAIVGFLQPAARFGDGCIRA